jgi:GNAT superfamily N-acetyltransferase
MSLLQELIESDARYFELGARIETVEGAVVVSVPGLADLAAGCVIQRVKPAEISQGYEGWIQDVEEQVRCRGAAWSRIYLCSPHDALEQALADARYCRRVEVAFVSTVAPSAQAHAVCLRPVCTEDDWRLKERLHEQPLAGSDGYHHDPARWVSLMRTKAATGFKEPYLIEQGGRAVGEVALMEMQHLMRLKNLFILPEARGKGLGVAAVALAWDEAVRRGKGAIGVLGIEGSPGARLYQRCGLRPETGLLEWSRRL